MNSALRNKLTSQDYRSVHDFFINPETGDVCDDYSDEVVLQNADRHEDSPPLVHPRTGQIFHPWSGEILNITAEQALDLKEENEFFENYYQQLEYRQKNRIKGSNKNRVSQHDFIIHPLSGDIHDASSFEIILPNEERREDLPPITHPKTGQIYDTWTGEALNLTPRQIIFIKNDIDNAEYFRQQRAERRRKEEQHEADE